MTHPKPGQPRAGTGNGYDTPPGQAVAGGGRGFDSISGQAVAGSGFDPTPGQAVAGSGSGFDPMSGQALSGNGRGFDPIPGQAVAGSCSGFDTRAAMDVAAEAVEAACAILLAGQADLAGLRHTVKAPGDIATDIDRRAEEAIRRRIRRAYPGHAFLGEETGASGTAPFRWIVDPLDGTVNYVRGFPYYAVSVALEHEGRPLLGLVADPARAECFAAIAGGGAFCNGRPLAVAGRTRLDEAVVGTVVPPPRFPGLDDYLARFCAVARQAAGVRRAGAAALDLAAVAAGRLDAFFVVSLARWDVAAGTLLVTEAGGAVADIDGGDDPLGGNRLVAANRHLLPALLPLLSGKAGRP
ncbi:MAG: inositol monophosphatase family protein [Solidesulfovibrio sp. DCME]|uniref:inositol monophosphatase family protein n=1 Tax=Solidesulfovibrio sp. DCME TaxID=3447380 RepID=UPI003D0C1334